MRSHAALCEVSMQQRSRPVSALCEMRSHAASWGCAEAEPEIGASTCWAVLCIDLAAVQVGTTLCLLVAPFRKKWFLLVTLVVGDTFKA